MALENRDITPLGFDIQQSHDCIFVESVKPNGPADKSGNVFVGKNFILTHFLALYWII